MRTSFLRLLILAFALAGMLVACDTPPPRPSYADIRFTDEPPIRLAVAAIDIASNFKPSFQSPDVEHLFPVPPARALENWAHDRLQAAGGTGRARFTIVNAKVVETELPKKKEGITGALTKEVAERYDATVEAKLDLVDDHGVPVRTVNVISARSQSVLEGITPNERDQTWYDMTKALMADFDQRMSNEISSHFGGYFK